MNKFTLVKLAVKLYFITALGFSFTHIATACGMLGASRVEAVAATLMIDGFFVLGAIMRTEIFATRFRKIGLWVQIGAGALSLLGNVYAARSTFGVLFGIALPLFVVFTEWLADPKQMQTAKAEAEALAVAAAEAAVRAAAEAAEAERIARNAKARDRRAEKRAAVAKANAEETRRVRRAAKALEPAAA